MLKTTPPIEIGTGRGRGDDRKRAGVPVQVAVETLGNERPGSRLIGGKAHFPDISVGVAVVVAIVESGNDIDFPVGAGEGDIHEHRERIGRSCGNGRGPGHGDLDFSPFLKRTQVPQRLPR